MTEITFFEDLKKLAGLRLPNDPFFDDGNKLITQFKEYGFCEVDDEDYLHEIVKTFDCDILGCKKKFDTVFLFEQHYNAHHRYVCAECKKTLTTPHLLDLHVAETHDSFFAAQAERKPMFQCFTKECQLVFQSPQLRKDHCIKDHDYPNSFWADKPLNNTKKTKKPSKPKKVANQEDAMELDIVENKAKFLGQSSKGRQRIFVNFSKDLSDSLPKL